ncbi:hypothetical protein RHAL1_03429 [Beijerinckiaceae bacterium RH AL1]|nr:histidine phosphatase family protein [Beijerinckiaceae bacterium]VVB48651.1 hypothetical protein RHCH11_RHCH11_03363 [Beijerinckiaceae bacterium RH CH11]VVB48732.1 hypothetical protein RHAL8_03359 [Beijerinckiaceae bacterium RH AL8]VVC56501.1 hypothetical protein RHAL1_03429 [Beijerinckiaceae bacterium RH AL1]
MPPHRIMFIRHAEKPKGPDDEGIPDPESLDPRGWQRANALVEFFLKEDDTTPRRIFAAAVEHHSPSKRPIQTVTPLVTEFKRRNAPVSFDTSHPKDDVINLMKDVLAGDGITLVCWEHHKIPGLCGSLVPHSPPVPTKWPDNRFDMVWIMDRNGGSWSFSQKPQMLLPGDSPDPISEVSQ